MESCVLNDGNMILSLWKFLFLIQIIFFLESVIDSFYGLVALKIFHHL